MPTAADPLPPHRRSLRGALAGLIRRTVPAEAWAEARERAWREAVSGRPAAAAGDDAPPKTTP